MNGNSSHTNFHFQPCEVKEWNGQESPLLYTSNPPGRSGSVTLFFRTRKTLRRRLGVHDLGEIDGVLSERQTSGSDHQMQRALDRVTNWHYLFPEPHLMTAEEAVRAEQFSEAYSKAVKAG